MRGPVDGAFILRTPAEFQRALREIPSAAANGSDPAATEEQKFSQQRAQLARDEYAAQLRLRDLERQQSQVTLDAALAEQRIVERLHQTGTASSTEALRADSSVTAARSRLRRIETLLELYRKVAPPASSPAK